MSERQEKINKLAQKVQEFETGQKAIQDLLALHREKKNEIEANDMLSPKGKEAELKKLEAELLKATRELLNLEDRYRSDKMELLAMIEAYEAKLSMLKSMID